MYASDIIFKLRIPELVPGLGEERNDCCAGVAADDRNGFGRWVRVVNLGDEARCTDYVQSGYTEKTFGVVNTFGLEDLGGDGDGRVDLVGSQY